MITAAQLKTVTDALEALTSVRAGNENEIGYWRRIALALEEGAGVTNAANDTRAGWMLRAALAAETQWGGSGAEENSTQAGLLKRIVDAMEIETGVSSGSFSNRLSVASGLVAFTPPTLLELAQGYSGYFWDGSDLSFMRTDNTGEAVAPVDGGLCGRWIDKAQALHLNSPAGSTARPTVNVVSGDRAVIFDAVNDYQQSTAPANTRAAQMTIAVACHRVAGTTRADPISSGNGGAFATLNWLVSTTDRLRVACPNPAAWLDGPLLPAPGNDMVLFVQCDGTNVTMQVDKGTPVTTAGVFATTEALKGLTVGASNSDSAPGNYFPGRIHGVLVLPGLLTASEKTAALDGLATLQGRTL